MRPGTRYPPSGGAAEDHLSPLRATIDRQPVDVAEHGERVAGIAVAIAVELGWSDAECDLLHTAGLLHDLGKSWIPADVLERPGPLDEAEYALVKRHPTIGATALNGLLAPSQVAWVRHHHERVDGRGYPHGLRGEEIPDGALVIAVADAWDALVSDRCYRAGVRPARALAELWRCAGTQFSIEVVRALTRLYLRVRGGGALAPSPRSAASPGLGATRSWGARVTAPPPVHAR
jgi:HD-GYP domain-containing protein (c-di-GMP phosphodiesterase class II)